MIPTIVHWVFAPDWLTLEEAAALMGPAYSAAAIETLIEIGAVDAEQDRDGTWLVEKRSLREYRDALWEVADDAFQE